MHFEFATARTILFGPGRIGELGSLAASFGRRVVLLTGGRSLAASGRLDRIDALLAQAGVARLHLEAIGEPTVESVDDLTARARAWAPDAVVAVGGGSVLDAGKALAALLANGGSAIDYLEGVGRGRPLDRPAIPLIAAPTTAGTGSEATRNAVIGDRARTFKKSMRSAGMLPAAALVDPELTRECPSALAAACGMDALTQLLEAYVSRRAGPMTDALAERGLAAARALERLIEGDADDSAREAMALAALLSGVCLANAGLGAAHGLAAPVGARIGAAHGTICAALLPPVIRTNAARARRNGLGALLEKYAAAARCLTGQALAPEALADWIETLRQRAGLPGLGALGIARSQLPAIVADGRGHSMRTNPVDLSDDELSAILDAAL